MITGHDWRTAIGPRAGYFQRCRTCYSTRELQETPEVPQPGRSNATQPEQATAAKRRQGRKSEAA